MCGIAGIIGNMDDRHKLMDQMLVSQHHRGPDFTGKFDLDNCGILGHNRLCIIDLHEEANQPFHSMDDRYTMVFNGEIYNYIEIRAELQPLYTFRTESDTEVLLVAYQQWGKKCLDHFNGMFAFAIWDNHEKTLFVARDRFGVKPFYYAVYEGIFYFASEIKALWAAGIPKIPNASVWSGYFTYGTYGMPDETFWEGIQQLPGGHLLEWENRVIQINQWYDFVERVKSMPVLSEQEVINQWTEIAIDSIRLRFRANVPVGINISGGLDSSLLLALVHRQYPSDDTIEAFTFYTGDDRYDELPWAECLIAQTALPLNPVKLTAHEIPNLAEKINYFEDEPHGGIPVMAYSKLFQAAREKGILVLLDGQGMDEVWAGYDYYLTNVDRLVQGTLCSPIRPECLNSTYRALAIKPIFPRPFDSDLLNLQYRDLFYTKIPRSLRFNDRISMMHSTELREPFLDYRLVELAFALPEHMKIKDGQQKWLARSIADEFLPITLALAPKRPLQTPQREWLGDELAYWTKTQIGNLEACAWFDTQKVNQEVDLYMDGDQDNSFYLWQWVNAGMIL